jgi:carbonic anhydrase
MHTHTRESQASLTPAEARQLLKHGNARFCANLKANRNLLQQVNATRDGQWPFAVILSCIDSRTSAELIFDQGLGDIFSIRIAGNFLNEDILGSMEFACQVAGAKLVVVLGHTQCGAIKGACDGVELGHLSGLLAKIRPAVEAVPEPHDPSSRCSANAAFVEAVAHENVRRAVDLVPQRSEVLRERLEAGAIDVVGAIYDVGTGAVSFLDDPAVELAPQRGKPGAKAWGTHAAVARTNP